MKISYNRLLNEFMMHRHVQCVLNFNDNLTEDGGTLVVPYFHSYLPVWNNQNIRLRKSLPWVTLPSDVELVNL